MKFKSLHERKEQFRKFEKQWLNESSMDMLKTKEWLDKMGVENYTINDDGTVDVNGDVFLSDKGLNEISVQFGVVSGDFNCAHNNLTSLEGCPKEVGGWFECAHNNLTSLEGGPKEVGGVFSCYNNNLTSLIGSPRKIDGNFNCSANYLTSLEGAPREVSWSFNCSDNPLETIDGLPQSIGDDLNVEDTNLSRDELKRIRQISNIGGKIFGLHSKDSIKKGVSTRRINFLKRKIAEMQKELESLQ